MTHMKRTTVSLPDDLAAAVRSLQGSAQFSGCSYSEIIRQLIRIGLDLDPSPGSTEPS